MLIYATDVLFLPRINPLIKKKEDKCRYILYIPVMNKIQDFKILFLHSDTLTCATWGHITCTKKNEKAYQNEHRVTIGPIQKFNSTVYIGTPTINHIKISMRTRKT